MTSGEAEEDRCPWKERVCQERAEGGQLAILKWARSVGCLWNENTVVKVMKLAAKHGHLDVLECAVATGKCAVCL